MSLIASERSKAGIKNSIKCETCGIYVSNLAKHHSRRRCFIDARGAGRRKIEAEERKFEKAVKQLGGKSRKKTGMFQKKRFVDKFEVTIGDTPEKQKQREEKEREEMAKAKKLRNKAKKEKRKQKKKTVGQEFNEHLDDFNKELEKL